MRFLSILNILFLLYYISNAKRGHLECSINVTYLLYVCVAFTASQMRRYEIIRLSYMMRSGSFIIYRLTGSWEENIYLKSYPE